MKKLPQNKHESDPILIMKMIERLPMEKQAEILAILNESFHRKSLPHRTYVIFRDEMDGTGPRPFSPLTLKSVFIDSSLALNEVGKLTAKNPCADWIIIQCDNFDYTANQMPEIFDGKEILRLERNAVDVALVEIQQRYGIKAKIHPDFQNPKLNEIIHIKNAISKVAKMIEFSDQDMNLNGRIKAFNILPELPPNPTPPKSFLERLFHPNSEIQKCKPGFDGKFHYKEALGCIENQDGNDLRLTSEKSRERAISLYLSKEYNNYEISIRINANPETLECIIIHEYAHALDLYLGAHISNPKLMEVKKDLYQFKGYTYASSYTTHPKTKDTGFLYKRFKEAMKTPEIMAIIDNWAEFSIRHNYPKTMDIPIEAFAYGATSVIQSKRQPSYGIIAKLFDEARDLLEKERYLETKE